MFNKRYYNNIWSNNYMFLCYHKILFKNETITCLYKMMYIHSVKMKELLILIIQ